MKKFLLSIGRLLLLLFNAIGILSAICLVVVSVADTDIDPYSYGYIIAAAFTVAFLNVASRRGYARRAITDIRLVFWLKHELFQTAAAALQNIPCDCAATCPPGEAENREDEDCKFSYLTEHTYFTFAKQTEEVLCNNMAEQLEPLFLYLKELYEKMYEIEEDSRCSVALKSYPDAGYRIQVLLDSRSQWTIFFVPSQDASRIEKNYFYRLKPLCDGWFTAFRG